MSTSPGAVLRDRGVQQLEFASLWDPWPRNATRAIAALGASGREFTAEEIREMVGDPDRPGLMGAAFLQVAKAGLIEQVGFRRAERAQRRRGVLAVRRGVWHDQGSASYADTHSYQPPGGPWTGSPVLESTGGLSADEGWNVAVMHGLLIGGGCGS